MLRLEKLDREQLDKLDKETLLDLLLAALARIDDLEGLVAEQAVLIQQLQDQVAKNSSNSSKPPSSDGLKKPKSRSLRQKGQHPLGGQPGHQGNTLKMVAEPDHVVLHDVGHCPHCQCDLAAIAAVGYERRQVFDIPPIRLEVTEHQVAVKPCPACGQGVKGEFPPGVTQATQYGPRLKVQASYLNIYHFIPLARLDELLTDLYGQSPTEAVLIQTNDLLAAHVKPSLAVSKQQLVSAPVAHFDESGLRVENKLQWLHVVSTPELTHYHVHAKRGQEGMTAGGILPEFRGKAVHDHFASYLQFDNSQHCFCNVHHLRELQFVAEQYQQSWASDMTHLLLSIKAEVAATPAPAMSLPADRLAHYEAEYDKLMAEGRAANPPPTNPPPKKRGRRKQTPPQNLLDRLRKHKSGVLAFMYDFAVPFDNNLAERDVRMVKVKQKVSGAFRTKNGADTFCALRSYISTARKQGQNVMDALYDAFLGNPFIPYPREA
ncbi:MAG: IS66 family transposase [Chloroflexi bacterium]|nr:IS66 family transposase [Chloroflexota bacterium]